MAEKKGVALARRLGRSVARHKFGTAFVALALLLMAVATVTYTPEIAMGVVLAISYLSLFTALGIGIVQAIRRNYLILPEDRWWRVPDKILRDILIALAAVIEGIASFIGGLISVTVTVALLLLGLYIVIWIIKGMWEAA